MTRKSAASAKLVKPEQFDDLPPIEETFDNAKQAFINTLDVSIELSKRIDNLMNIRDYAMKFWGSEFESKFLVPERLDYFKGLQNLSTMTYQALKEATEKFELDAFLAEDLKDYYEDIIPKIDDILDESQMCAAGLIFLTVKPFGEKMAALHRTMLEEKAARDAQEKM